MAKSRNFTKSDRQKRLGRSFFTGPNINILDTINAMPRVDLEPGELETLIQAAQRGDNDATMRVLREHMSVLVGEITRSVRLVTQNGFAAPSGHLQDDVTSDALQVFLRVLAAYDPERAGKSRFGGMLKAALRRDENMNTAINRTRDFRIPVAVAQRRAAAIKEAGGDIEAARLLAKKHNISVETFDAISRVYAEGVSINNEEQAGLFGHSENGYVRIDDLIDTERALDALDFTSRMIVESAFGLNGQPEQSNAEIGANLGLSRWTVQRRIDAAMLVMQDALTNDKEEHTP